VESDFLVKEKNEAYSRSDTPLSLNSGIGHPAVNHKIVVVFGFTESRSYIQLSLNSGIQYCHQSITEIVSVRCF